MTELEKVKAAFEHVTGALLMKIHAVAGTGAEIERVALDAVHRALSDIVTHLTGFLDEAAAEVEKPAAPPATSAKPAVATQSASAKK